MDVRPSTPSFDDAPTHALLRPVVLTLTVAVGGMLPLSGLAQSGEKRNFTPAESAEQPEEKEAPAEDADEGEDDGGDERAETAPTDTAPPREETTGDSSSADDGDDAPAPIADPVEYCDGFMPAYLESAGRKLFRALSGQTYDLEKLKLQEWVDIRVEFASGDSKRVEFKVVREKEGRVAALVDSTRDYRRALVVAMTESGPVVASMTWPDRDQIAQKADCKPVRSEVLRPSSTTEEIAVEPFKYWGLRVVWQIPNSFSETNYDGPNMYETVVDLLSEDDEGE